jgi:hypothetical protein
MFALDRDCIFNRSSDFCPRMAKGPFVSFCVCCILLDKISSEFISLIWKGPHYDKSQEGMPRLQEDFAKSTAQQKSDPEVIIRTT